MATNAERAGQWLGLGAILLFVLVLAPKLFGQSKPAVPSSSGGSGGGVPPGGAAARPNSQNPSMGGGASGGGSAPSGPQQPPQAPAQQLKSMYDPNTTQAPDVLAPTDGPNLPTDGSTDFGNQLIFGDGGLYAYNTPFNMVADAGFPDTSGIASASSVPDTSFNMTAPQTVASADFFDMTAISSDAVNSDGTYGPQDSTDSSFNMTADNSSSDTSNFLDPLSYSGDTSGDGGFGDSSSGFDMTGGFDDGGGGGGY